MYHVRKSLQWARHFFAPSIPYSLVVAESPENCLRKVQSGLPVKSPERSWSFTVNQFFKIATDKQGDPQFRLLIKVESRLFLLLFSSTVISGTFHLLDTQRTEIVGKVRSPWLFFLMLMKILGVVMVISSLFIGDLEVLLFGLAYTLFVFYFISVIRKTAYKGLLDALRQSLES
ncbi:MAG: hypothetical protein HND46_14050 [Chloroflexi bacterium]|nr:hypothetical protein [Chloroflexota bacterium]NOG64535.1 hypothetical protein [Chloroflexota bacterium]